ncbi:hypothetical protein PENSUB_9044 [Penicillium subrubescens]|uniref:Uncharacterized protein n=1 Tax=Penicillium subrubescens TaxID=1316194 RepID=A0A1Q5TEG2_9EURO|nr:hypothetical protein PENSUB_9044 [Penicillium subrubescens]
MDQPAEPNTAAMHNVQRRRGSVGTTQLFDNIVSTSNFDRDEVDRLRKRFMKLDKVLRCFPKTGDSFIL